MKSLKVHDKHFIQYLDESVILDRIYHIAQCINQDYKDRKPLFLVILNGAFMFASDLFKSLEIDAEISFVKISSYHGMTSSGNINTIIGLDQDIAGRDIIILEDIIDTGKTLYEFLKQLKSENPASVAVAALLHKYDANKYSIKIDYLGFKVSNKFLLGYGLDYDGLGRNLRDIYHLEAQTA
jgi:hypoxanthine phosphoribosyltransferase